MAKMVHSMVRVMDDKKSIAFYDQAFGLKVADRIDFPDFSLIYMSNPETGFELELTYNKGRSESYNLGNGYGHLAFIVDNLAAEHARISALGYAPKDMKDFQNNGKTVAKFFFIDDPDGYKIEVIEKGGRFR